MQRLKNYRVVIHIKNHNLCIILILSFLLVSQRRIKCVFKNCGYSGGGKERPGPLPPLPRAGGGEINHG